MALAIPIQSPTYMLLPPYNHVHTLYVLYSRWSVDAAVHFRMYCTIGWQFDNSPSPTCLSLAHQRQAADVLSVASNFRPRWVMFRFLSFIVFCCFVGLLLSSAWFSVLLLMFCLYCCSFSCRCMACAACSMRGFYSFSQLSSRVEPSRVESASRITVVY